MDVQTATAAIAAFSSVLASIGLFFSGRQAQQARRTAILQALLEFVKGVRTHERELTDCNGDSAKLKVTLNDYVDFLEAYAAAHNHGLVTGVAETFVRDKLIDAANSIEAAGPAFALLRESYRTSDTVGTELGDFLRKHSAERKRRKTLEMQKAS